MLNKDELLSQETIELEEWHELISSKAFVRLVDLLNRKIDKYRREAEKLSLTPSLDNQFKITASLNRKDELQCLLNKFNFFLEQHRLYIISKQKGE